ncbi:MAG: DNA methyltransferase [bacterium]
METKQTFKSIYFPDLRDQTSDSKSFTLAFSDADTDLLQSVRYLSSYEIRNLIGVSTFKDLEKKAIREGSLPNRYCISKLKERFDINQSQQVTLFDPVHTTFKGGKELPLQSWYPYLEGYSPDFVKHILQNYIPRNARKIYDPFSGTGTTPLIASELGYTACYSEVNPLLQFLTQIKAEAKNLPNKKKIVSLLQEVILSIEKDILSSSEDSGLRQAYGDTFKESCFFSDKTFDLVLRTRTYINNLYFKDPFLSKLITVAVLSSLVENSLLKRQGDLRFRRGKELEELKSIDYFRSLRTRLQRILEDLQTIQPTPSPSLITEDARTIGKLPFLGIDAVITSPPYLNGTNYFRNTKIELWFLGYLKTPDNLNNFRRLAVTAGINDVALKVTKSIDNPELKKLLNYLEKETYDKRIPKMVHDYFADMETIFFGLKKQLNKDATLAIDLGDSIYAGVHVKTDEILISVLEKIGYRFIKNITLRRRQSNNGQELKQVLLIFKNEVKVPSVKTQPQWSKNWNGFKTTMPHHYGDMAKRNWGDPIHSLCSYQGKLKPSIANQLVSIFVPEGGRMLDIFGGVGTIPLEAALQNKTSYSFDISPSAVAISRAKLAIPSAKKTRQILNEIEEFLENTAVMKADLDQASRFGLNKTIKDYFHTDTLKEILVARRYFIENGCASTEQALVMSALMHILHGNRPYALSRRSHGITPFAPTGDFEYKSLVEKLREKVERTLTKIRREDFQSGEIYFQDTTKTWPTEIRDLDAIITSPPFFDSTRFYAANWMRLWFAGWNDIQFKTEPVNFIDELQKKDLSIYDGIFMQARERLKDGGVFVLHLGKSPKCNMANALAERATRWFKVHDIFEESVEDGESHGIKDRGSVTQHQYLVLV